MLLQGLSHPQNLATFARVLEVFTHHLLQDGICHADTQDPILLLYNFYSQMGTSQMALLGSLCRPEVGPNARKSQPPLIVFLCDPFNRTHRSGRNSHLLASFGRKHVHPAFFCSSVVRDVVHPKSRVVRDVTSPSPGVA